MFISNHIQSAAGVYASQPGASVRTAKRPAQGAKAGEFVMSSQAQSFRQTLLQLQGGAGDVRMDKVSALRPQVESGAYRVEAKTLAADLLAMRW